MPHDAPDRVMLSIEEPFQSSSLPNLVYRMCRTPDSSRVTGAWMMYEDENEMYSLDKGWDTPSTPMPRPYEIRDTKQHGRGVFAVRDIAYGEIVLRERPLILIPCQVPDTRRAEGAGDSSWDIIDRGMLQLLYWLEPEDRAVLLSMYNCKSAKECGPLKGILHTNSVDLELPQSKLCSKYAAICRDHSFFNHSCCPNTTRDEDAKTLIFQLRATRNIAAGEEITITYTNILAPRAERQSILRMNYKFTCDCSACSAGAPSDKHRELISTSVNSMDEWFAKPQWTTAANARRHIARFTAVLRAMDEEGITQNRLAFVFVLARAYEAIGDRGNATKWMAEAYRGWKTEGN